MERKISTALCVRMQPLHNIFLFVRLFALSLSHSFTRRLLHAAPQDFDRCVYYTVCIPSFAILLSFSPTHVVVVAVVVVIVHSYWMPFVSNHNSNYILCASLVCSAAAAAATAAADGNCVVCFTCSTRPPCCCLPLAPALFPSLSLGAQFEMNIYGTIDTFPFTRFFFSAHFFIHTDTESSFEAQKRIRIWKQSPANRDRWSQWNWNMAERCALLHTVLFPFSFLRSTTCHHRHHHHHCRHRHGGCGALFFAFFRFHKSKWLWRALPPLVGHFPFFVILMPVQSFVCLLYFYSLMLCSVISNILVGLVRVAVVFAYLWRAPFVSSSHTQIVMYKGA